ncbi:MAG: chemotaxis protein CheW [Gammaproteobacteria bacterium]
MSLAESKNYPTLSCMLLSLNGNDVLLPKSIVKEVIYKPNISLFEGEEDWLIGEIDWEDYVIPVVSFERLCNQTRINNSNHVRAVICYVIENTESFPLYAIEVQSMPRPLILDSRALYNQDGMMNKYSEMISYYVKIGSKELVIPNFQKLEEILLTRDSK